MNSVDAMDLIEDDNITGASDDDDDGDPSSPGSAYDDGTNLINVAMENEVTAQLVAAGVVGVAAAAAITSSKKKKRPHSFETNPSIRKRQQNRLLRKLRQTIFEYATRVGQQAVVLVATPGKPNNIFKVFGAKPLEDVLKNLRPNVMDKLDEALAAQAPPRVQDDPSLFELPPLIIDGIPTPVEKMTQAQLRAFIPLMLKYSTGRGKPGWGRDSTRPAWWPKELPWANVRMDARTEDEKQKISWTHALRKIVINCYKYHGREDLLPAFTEEDEKANAIATANSNVEQIKIQSTNLITTTSGSNSIASSSATNQQQIVIQHQSSNGTTISSNVPQTQIIKEISDGTIQIQQQPSPTQTLNAQVCLDSMALSDVDYTHTVLQTIQNADGTVSIIQVDPNNPIITLPDGTTAQVQGIATLQSQNDNGVHTIQTISDGQGESMSVDLTEATLGQDGQLIITGEDGQEYSYSGFPVNVSGMITVPVSAQMYQTMVANIQQLPNGDGTVCITPMQVHNQTPTVNLNSRTTTIPTQNVTVSTNSSNSNASNASTNLYSSSFTLNNLKRPRSVQNIANASVANFSSLNSQRNNINEQILNQLLANQSKKLNVIANNNNSNNTNNNTVKISLSKDVIDVDKSCQKSTIPQGIVIQLNSNILNAKDLLNDNLSAAIEKQVQLVKRELEEAQLNNNSSNSTAHSTPSHSPADDSDEKDVL
ncbi:DNA-binding protein Ewg isoform X1 [Toxorhynchites rutilus septentrionalis]|uniref:DNA-binding protein Ewg isoform X1 n=1 Tax=Toxorhynchites rutilus septentrionalis TaxID=329112 RepID=UPI002479DBC5|nr:DNA-binding protein Ewg isoform X1 [Toxorhynchites rutilus septentrionalis]XP_055636036.1 DNA-binding protein Ewg isoform X1 [Toxorhynchites rutilus septentrionalis]